MKSTSREPDRLLLATDAVVAIAITLLVLPLVELVAEPEPHARDVVTENWPRIWSFVLSFAVITRFWLLHHRTFDHVTRYSRPLVAVNMLWLFTIAIMPFPTGMVGTYGTDHFTATLYVATVLASSVCQSALVVVIYRTPAIQSPDNPLGVANVASTLSATGLLAVALLLTALAPGVNYLSLLLLVLSTLANRVWDRFRPVARG